MGTFRPYESWDRDFDKEFITKARFSCRVCGKDCSLKEGFLQADGRKMFAHGKCFRVHMPRSTVASWTRRMATINAERR